RGLTILEARSGNYLYDFVLDAEPSEKCGKVLLPSNPTWSEEERSGYHAVQWRAVARHIEELCTTVWPSVQCAVARARREEIILAVAAAMCPNKDFIPPPEMLQKLKEILVSQGFKQDARWFMS
ncbi:hypothetical protein DXG03_007181, partial [Asterophora parasitica]